MPVALVTGAGGFIGHHMVTYLKKRNYYVIAVSRTPPKFSVSQADEYITGDLSCAAFVESIVSPKIDEIYHFAADMGGAGYTFSQNNDADIMQNSLRMSVNLLSSLSKANATDVRVFYSSSACVYPTPDESEPNFPNCPEELAYPANPESDYGWEKLFSERLYMSYMRNYGINARIARLHTILGPECVFDGGREKVPAALARKVIQAEDGGEIKIWGSGEQKRSFLYIDDCLNAIHRLVQSDFRQPINIGSDELVSINVLARKLIQLSGKKLTLKHIEGPIGPSARNSDNRLIEEQLGWKRLVSLDDSLKVTYEWIRSQIN